MACPRTISCWRLAFEPRPARQPGIDEAGGEFAEFGLDGAAGGFDFAAGLVDRVAADARVEIIARLDEGGGRQAARDLQDAVFDRTVLGDEHGKGAFGFETDEFDMFQPGILLRGDDDAGPARQAREQGRRLGVDRLRASDLSRRP